MKKVIHAIAITALSLCCIQTMSPAKQSVRASKQDSLDEREVTVKILGSAGAKKPISSSIFKRDTDGFAKKLHFDFTKGIPDRGGDGNINKILVVYTDKPTEEFSISVAQKDVPKGSEIKIGSNTIEIDLSKVKKTQTEEKIIIAKVQPASGTWRIITGNNDLKKERAKIFAESASLSSGIDVAERINRVYAGYPEILDDISCNHPNCLIQIYENKPTRIYAAQNGNNGYVTLLTQANIKRAGREPIIIIGEDAKAIITNQEELYKHKGGNFSQEAKVLADLIALLLTEDEDAAYRRYMQKELTYDKVTTIMQNRLYDTLAKHKYITLNSAKNQQFKEKFERNLKALQDLYQQIYDKFTTDPQKWGATTGMNRNYSKKITDLYNGLLGLKK